MSQTQAESIKDGSIVANDLATDSVITSKIQNGAVTRDKLADLVKPTPFTTRGFNIPL
jgi:hypothetical protein